MIIKDIAMGLASSRLAKNSFINAFTHASILSAAGQAHQLRFSVLDALLDLLPAGWGGLSAMLSGRTGRDCH
ncbi:MAG: hypothetical protein LUO89_10550 [Methanothrix sp.]|nr:hypothetical protein [Methanothrix sp.]